jgi:hypothetical protein
MALPMELHGAAAVQPAVAEPLGETKSPSGSGPMHEVPLHSRKPASHVNPHLLLVHFSCALGGGLGQTSPQPPQLVVSSVVLAHSVGAAVGHAVSPALQSRVHAPAAHAG